MKETLYYVHARELFTLNMKKRNKVKWQAAKNSTIHEKIKKTIVKEEKSILD